MKPRKKRRAPPFDWSNFYDWFHADEWISHAEQSHEHHWPYEHQWHKYKHWPFQDEWQKYDPRPRTRYWSKNLHDKRRFLFWRFLRTFGIFPLIVFIVFIFILSKVFDFGSISLANTGNLLILICGLPVVISILATVVSIVIFNRIAVPLADVMTAADAVAEGDLSVRLKEKAPGEFGNLARSFNRMTSELQRADQQRRNLTADVAHELRTPLHIIQGNLEGVLDGVYQANPKIMQNTLDETRLLTRLVDDLQTLSLAEAGQLPLHPMPVKVADLLADVITGFEGQAAEAGISLESHIPEIVGDLELHIDPDRISQVLNNLVSNALRYVSEGGWIHLGAEAQPGGVRLSVEDNGAGISEEDLPYIFDRFWRSDRSRTRQEGSGSGLGLAIARQLVQAHGGKISVESHPGEGTKFIIDLPIN
ncbi:MAG: HAMP domain-containing protein [Anaerolineales bacterium]|nr:HAMP domain-containing protein [Anaerolineales bacterium]